MEKIGAFVFAIKDISHLNNINKDAYNKRPTDGNLIKGLKKYV